MEKSEKVTLFAGIILIGFVLGVIYHYILGFYFKLPELYNSFLYPARLAFCDFFGSFPYIKNLAPYSSVTLWTVYFPLAVFFLYPFSLIKFKTLAYLIYLLPFLLYLIKKNAKNFYCENLTQAQNFQNIFILTFASYPVLYCLDKGNIDMYLFILLGIWAYAFKDRKYGVSAFILGVMNAVKPFTLYFLLFYLIKKRYKEFFFSIILTIILIFGGFMLLHDSFSTQFLNFLKCIAHYKEQYALSNIVCFGFCSSVFMPLKAVMLHFSTTLQDMASFVKYYDLSCHFITLITLFFVWKEKIFWKQITLLICNFLLLPYCTYDYKLIFLFIPVWFFMNEKGSSKKSDLTYLLLFSLLLIPKNIMVVFPLIKNGPVNWLSFSAIVNPVIILALSLFIIYEQITNKRKKKENEI